MAGQTAGEATGRVAGLDGCPGGWVCVRWDGASHALAERLSDLALLFEGADAPHLAAIDIPLGLPERAGAGGRAPERLVRPHLGGRQSSVFSVPARAAVEAGAGEGEERARYVRACAVARATSDPPRSMSKQCFHILPKVLEAGRLLRARADLRERLFECHPEVSFWAMNGRREVPVPKKIKGRVNPAGLEARLALLAAAGFPTQGITAAAARALQAGFDDLVDACAAAWSARRIQDGVAMRFPDPPEQDAHGLAVAIHA
ncbi:MAG: DUF429 domain-containing protein [Pseudomonadota bacterium]